MIGADSWIAKPGWTPFCDEWWKAVLWKLPRRILIHKYERFTRGLSRYDAIHPQSFISDAIAAVVYKRFVHSNSHPPEMSHETWLGILLDIRDGFTRPEDDCDWVPSEKAWRLLKKYYGTLWD